MIKRLLALVLLGLTARAEIVLQETAGPLPFAHQGPFVRAGDIIDLGAAGNYRDPVTGLNATTHGGGIEGTVLEKTSGELMLLLRVPPGCFFVSTSKDGVKWTTPSPSTIGLRSQF